jgi:hypothetical protein
MLRGEGVPGFDIRLYFEPGAGQIPQEGYSRCGTVIMQVSALYHYHQWGWMLVIRLGSGVLLVIRLVSGVLPVLLVIRLVSGVLLVIRLGSGVLPVLLVICLVSGVLPVWSPGLRVSGVLPVRVELRVAAGIDGPAE